METLSYTAIWAIDFEFVGLDGEHPAVVCMVAHDLLSGRWVRIWRGDFSAPPFLLDENSLFVGYAAAAEWSCFLSLGWPLPLRCIDLYAEFIRVTNGAFNGKLFPSLLTAALHFGVDTMSTDHKGAMRELILSGGPWSEDDRQNILQYCAADVSVTADLFQAMLPQILKSQNTFGGAMLRGRYTCAVARMEWYGIPIDVATLDRIRSGWDDIKLDLIDDIDRQYGIYSGTTFSAAKFTEFVTRHDIPWPRYPNGDLMLDDGTFRERAKSYPIIAPLRELRHAMGQMRLNKLAVGQDGRNRTSLMPFSSKTGRNQPSSTRFIFGTSRWLRSLIKPTYGRALIYVDWCSQEIAIAAALSRDDLLWNACETGDPYLAFAVHAGLVPPGATKLTHKSERQRAKAILLGVGYGMSAESMALRAGLHVDEARDLLIRHKLTYRKFWEWAISNQNAGLLGFTLQTSFGWTWKAGPGTTVNPRSLLNWPMQAAGAEMMRLACCKLTEQGVALCCPVHDALLVECSTFDIDQTVSVTTAAMEHASELVLGQGRVVKTDVKVISWPNRYESEAGIAMWDRVMARLAARGW